MTWLAYVYELNKSIPYFFNGANQHTHIINKLPSEIGNNVVRRPVGVDHVYYGPSGIGTRLVPQRVCHDPLGEHVRHGDDVLVALGGFPEGADETHTQHLPPALHLDGREFGGHVVSLLTAVAGGTVLDLKTTQ